MLLKLDAESSTPAYQQIRDALVVLIEGGSLRPGARLPASRALARKLGVHRSTVVRAYEELGALGHTESRSGAYTTVRGRARPPSTSGIANEARTQRPAPRMSLSPSAPAQRAHARIGPSSQPELAGGEIDFARLAPDPRLCPSDDLRRCFRGVLASAMHPMFDYCAPNGWRPLREVIAMRLRAHGIALSADEILVTAGAQHALDLCLRLFARAGDAVLVEAPTYGVFHSLLQLHDVRPIEIPMRSDGMDLDALARALERQPKPRLLYTMPTFHNPTGTTTTQAHRERLLSLCEHAHVPIVEDGFEEEMKYFGKAVLPIKSMDTRGIVLYVNALSKVVFPGARVGWIAAPRDTVDILTSLLHSSSLAVSSIEQAVITRFCTGRGLETYLRRAHRIYRKRMQSLIAGLDAHLPPRISWTRPTGGYTAWLTLPDRGAREGQLVRRLRHEGVHVTEGSRFFSSPPPRVQLRLSIARVDEKQIAVGCRRLGSVLARS